VIVEMREYTLQHGSVPEYLRLYEEEGMAIQVPILGTMYGYFHTEVGVQNQVVHLWAYRDHADREARRARLQADPAWKAYLPKIRPLLLWQQTRIMRPAPFFSMEVTA
jgi:NIPSNAP